MMPRDAREPRIDRAHPVLSVLVNSIATLADERYSNDLDFKARTEAALAVVCEALWVDEQNRLEQATTHAELISVGGEVYKKIQQKRLPQCIYHGLWEAHRVEEPTYRLTGVRNGPTIKPLAHRVGAVSGSLLPNLAEIAGDLMSRMTSRDVEEVLLGTGFRPPSRSTLEKRVGDMFVSMATCVLELESECRAEEEIDFDLGAVSCGLDHFAASMVEDLPEGPLRDEKLAERRPEKEYQRTPVDPYATNWRMAWVGNVTMYDTEGNPRRTYRYGADAGSDPDWIAARIVDDVVELTSSRHDIPVVCIQDGAKDLDCLRREIKERLPEGVPRSHLVDFHHAIGYLDAVASALPDGEFEGAGAWFRKQLLIRKGGSSNVIAYLRKRSEQSTTSMTPALADSLNCALPYFENRRQQLGYAASRSEGLPIGSGATESTCGLFQLRVKHPGSHWRTAGLRRTMAARGLQLSGRWNSAFAYYRGSLRQDVVCLS